MSYERPGPEYIGTTGASDGDFLGYDPDTDEWVPMPLPGATVPPQLVPLTTVVGGVPDLVWDSDNQLVLTEAP